jgi:hypothetical protein
VPRTTLLFFCAARSNLRNYKWKRCRTLDASLPTRKYFFCTEISSLDPKSHNLEKNFSSLCELGVNQENNPWTIRSGKEIPTRLEVGNSNKWDMQETKKRIDSLESTPTQKP